jgi:hypothetical protein
VAAGQCAGFLAWKSPAAPGLPGEEDLVVSVDGKGKDVVIVKYVAVALVFETREDGGAMTSNVVVVVGAFERIAVVFVAAVSVVCSFTDATSTASLDAFLAHDLRPRRLERRLELQPAGQHEGRVGGRACLRCERLGRGWKRRWGWRGRGEG